VQYSRRERTGQRVPHYQRTFLKQVILRLDFNRIAVLQTDVETPFTQDMRQRYPDVTSNPTTGFSVTMTPSGPTVSQQPTGWMRVHKTPDTARSVTLAPDFVAIEYGQDAYHHFDELRDQVTFILASFRNRFGQLQFTRIGLRYVNEITFAEGGALDWAGLINPNLVTSVNAGMLDQLRMARSVHHLVAQRDDISVILNYGISNPDYPNPVARRVFVIDLDCYISGVVESAEAEQRISDINHLAEEMFEHSIEDGLRNIMGIVP
jgi:uncharacterized protein (TIGR04255 family)